MNLGGHEWGSAGQQSRNCRLAVFQRQWFEHDAVVAHWLQICQGRMACCENDQ
jgi:hypothetical protein